MSTDIIGKTLSIITKAESRYEGTLVEVDTAKKTMSVKNVKNMGTEGRRNGVGEIAATENILGMVKFKVELIKEFNIVETNDEQESDPAIIESTEATQAEDKKEKEPWARGTRVNTTRPTTEEPNEKVTKTGDNKDTNRQRGELKENPNESMQKKYAPDQFEFTNKEITSEPKPEKADDQKPKYVKNDFFDQLTNSTLEERPQRGGRGGRGGFRGGEMRGNYRGGDSRGGYRGNYQDGGEDSGFRGGYRGRGNTRGSNPNFPQNYRRNNGGGGNWRD